MRVHPGARGLVWSAIAAIVLGGCGVARLWEPTREEVLDRILPSAVQIVVEQQEGRRVRTGSGVVVAWRPTDRHSDCFVLTSGHTMTGIVGQKQVYVVFDQARRAAKRVPATVVAYRDAADVDLALLRAEASPCTSVPSGPPPLLGTPVWVVGFPWGRHMTLSSGIVSQINADDRSDPETAARLMVDAPVSYGSSGGGVYDARTGMLIGIVEGYSTARVAPQGASPAWYIDVPVPGQTYVTPLSDVRRFLGEHGFADLLGGPGSGLGATAVR